MSNKMGALHWPPSGYYTLNKKLLGKPTVTSGFLSPYIV